MASKERFRISTILLLLAIFLLSIPTAVHGHESCCNKHKLKQEPEFITDPNDTAAVPPDEFQGQPRFIPNPTSIKPDDWDDEFDGEWEASFIENAHFQWSPRRIKNPNYVQPPTLLAKYQAQVQEAIPWVTLGVALTAILASVLSCTTKWRESLQNILSQENNHPPTTTTATSRIRIRIVAALLGLATPLCSCGALPLVSGLVLQQGVSLSLAVTFLTASQSAGLDSLAITWGLLGPLAALARLGGAMVLALAVGMVIPQDVRVVKQQQQQLDIVSNNPETTKSKDSSSSSGKRTSTPATTTAATTTSVSVLFKQLVLSMVDTAWEIFPVVSGGLFVSTAVVHYLPLLTTNSSYPILETLLLSQQSLSSSSSFSFYSLLVRLGVLLSALPLQLCEHTTVTYAAGIQKAGGSPGLAFAFLLCGPATNLPTLLLLSKTATAAAAAAAKSSSSSSDTSISSIRNSSHCWIVLRVVAALVGTALALSYIVDVVGIDMLVQQEATTGSSSTTMTAALPSWYVKASPWLAGGLAVAVVIGKVWAAWTKNTASNNNGGDDCCDHTNCGSNNSDSGHYGKKKTN
jgi:uncharacterized membrane protein YraQ (UPF0718 family)